MSTSPEGGSAKIYQFPVRGRFAQSGRPNESKSAAYLASPPIAPIVYGSGWYHDEAIEAERARNT